MIGPTGMQRRAAAWLLGHFRFAAARIAILAAVNAFAFLGLPELSAWDEQRYEVSALEMVRSGDAIVTTYGGRPDYENLKPPLALWLMSACCRIFGEGHFALRFPSACAAVLGVLLTIAGVRRAADRRTALLAGLFLATCYPYFLKHSGRSANADAVLTLFLALASYALLRLEASRWAGVSVGASLGAGFLAKSFAILPNAALAAICLLRRRDLIRRRGAPLLAGALLFAAIVGGWAWLRFRAEGHGRFFGAMVAQDIVGKGTEPLGQRESSPLYYVAILARQPAVLVILVGGAAWLWSRRHRAPGEIGARSIFGGELGFLSVAWVAITLVLFSVIPTRHFWYINPVYPALAVLAALAVTSLGRRAASPFRVLVALAALILPAVIGEAQIVRGIQRDLHPTHSNRHVP